MRPGSFASCGRLDSDWRSYGVVESDLRRRSKSSEQVAAVIVALLDRTAIRVGNEEYVRENGSYGLTTLRRRHVKIDGDRIRLRFREKIGSPARRQTDPRLAKLLADYQACGGAMLFACLPGESGWQLVDSDDVNAYLHAVIGEGFTAKDFRTWQASATVAGRLHASLPVETKRQRREAIRSAIGEAAELLGNTTTVCRNSYVHPVVGSLRNRRVRSDGGRLSPQKVEAILARGTRLVAIPPAIGARRIERRGRLRRAVPAAKATCPALANFRLPSIIARMLSRGFYFWFSFTYPRQRGAGGGA
ncbi:MAG: hypothetical protein R3C99_10195 [Pirellulaceae bacterium]